MTAEVVCGRASNGEAKRVEWERLGEPKIAPAMKAKPIKLPPTFPSDGAASLHCSSLAKITQGVVTFAG